jgi:DNA-binding response OmpR family regulator
MPDESTILIIDDEVNLRRSLSLILQRNGYKVTCAASAHEGLQFLLAGPYDLVFLDIKLPDRSGISILPEIRQQYPEMPVLILTAHASLETAIEAVRQGARDYLLKPIDPQKIILRTQEVLAELAQPKRRREITSQIQNLLAELHQIEGAEALAEPLLATLPSTDPARFLRCGVFELDLHTRHASINNRFIQLSPSNFDYLVTLLRHAPEAVTFQTLVRESQGYNVSRAEAREISRWQIHQLRKALEGDPHQPHMIVTMRDVGYRLIV